MAREWMEITDDVREQQANAIFLTICAAQRNMGEKNYAYSLNTHPLSIKRIKHALRVTSRIKNDPLFDKHHTISWNSSTWAGTGPYDKKRIIQSYIKVFLNMQKRFGIAATLLAELTNLPCDDFTRRALLTPNQSPEPQ